MILFSGQSERLMCFLFNVLFCFQKKFNITSPTSTRTNPENDSANQRATSIGRMTSGGSSRHIVNNATRLYSQQHTKWSDCAKENKLECNDAPSQVWLFKIELKDHSLYCESWLWLNRSRYHLLAYLQLHCFTAVRLKKWSVVMRKKQPLYCLELLVGIRSDEASAQRSAR